MEFFELEKTLKRLSNNNRFDHTAEELEGILADEDTDAKTKASEIVEFIKSRIEFNDKRFDYTTEELEGILADSETDPRVKASRLAEFIENRSKTET